MFQALFNSLSGLFSFSRSLDTVSNNVSNMNTPGFRGSDSFFANIDGGYGTSIAGQGLRPQPGDLRQTGTPTDMAVEGEGYFVLRDRSGELHYTRAGQFRFNDSGVLVDTVTGYDVMAIGDDGALTQIDINAYRTMEAKPTTRVKVGGNLATRTVTATSPATPINATMTVYDTVGATHALSVVFLQTDNIGNYSLTIKDETGFTVYSDTVRFSGGRLLTPNVATFDLSYAGKTQQVTLDFGTSTSGLSAMSGVSDPPKLTVEDGHGVLGISSMAFDDKGILRLSYSSTETREGQRVALAIFPNEGDLRLAGGRMLDNSSIREVEHGRAGQGRFGRISGGSVELSNIDLTREFADMIIIQRGYQASSRVMTVSNEMIEQLYNSTRGG